MKIKITNKQNNNILITYILKLRKKIKKHQ